MKRCTLCKCPAVATAFGFAVCDYHRTRGEDEPACPNCVVTRESLGLGPLPFELPAGWVAYDPIPLVLDDDQAGADLPDETDVDLADLAD